MDFKKIDNKYRSVPFWSWNEKLETDESRRQVAEMEQAGIGGFFMHARGGLQTEYMGDEWFENVNACIEESEARGMHAWAYDENGWPSGFGNGLVNGKGISYQQKYLRYTKCRENEPEEERIIYRTDELCFYYDVNPFYVDTLNGEVIADFLHEIYEPYHKRFGTRFDGFFTDEPQISRNGIPWSFILPEEYEKAYGDVLFPHLPELFFQTGDYQTTRIRFWKLVTELFSKNFMKQIYEYCHAHGLKFTGHLVLEERLDCQLTSNGACMPHYEYFDIPGMDWLGRPIYRCLTAMQVSSVAAQTGKKQILSEAFAMCGHNVSHDELKRNYEWMMVRGINLLCQHLEGYSLRGIRKRDYPPAMYLQQPWWEDYKQFNDAMSRIGMLLAEGEIEADTLLIHPQTTAWICFDNVHFDEIRAYNRQLLDLMDILEQKHIAYHLGDEILMERHAYVENGALILGKMRYTKIILPPHIAFLENTERLLAEFKASGGQIVTAEALPANNIVNDARLTYTKRKFPDDGLVMHYFVNSTEHEIDASFTCQGNILDIATGSLLPFDGTYHFPKWGSLVVIDDGTAPTPKKENTDIPLLSVNGTWKVVHATENALTLDKCTYYFDGILEEENGYILNVSSRALEKERPVDILCRFTVYADEVPETLWLAMETPEKFEVSVNGKKVDTSAANGYFRDRSFRKLDISGMLQKGENIIETRVLFFQSAQTYENLQKARIFESEKNKLTYDTEIEAMYLVGAFGVRTDGEFEEIANDASYFDGKFILTAPPEEVTATSLERQGYPFFAGELTLEKTVFLSEADTNLGLAFEKAGVNAIRAEINGHRLETKMWAPYTYTLTPYLHAGENKIRLTLVNNLRNLLGPHHHKNGELLSVAPRHFFAEPCIWTNFENDGYDTRYCFVKTGLHDKPIHNNHAEVL